MIRSFRCKETAAIFHRSRSRIFSAIELIARRKLRMLDDAVSLEDIARIPGNRLERLRGDRNGQYSIRFNEQWRICFSWHDGAVESVEIVDYHR